MSTSEPNRESNDTDLGIDLSIGSGSGTETDNSTNFNDAARGRGWTNARKAVKHKLHLQKIRATGPSRFLNHTSVRVQFRRTADEAGADVGTPNEKSDEDELAVRWQPRDNRKGRNPATERLSKTKPSIMAWMVKSWLLDACKGIWCMFSTLPY